MEEVDVDEIRLRELWELAVPCRRAQEVLGVDRGGHERRQRDLHTIVAHSCCATLAAEVGQHVMTLLGELKHWSMAAAVVGDAVGVVVEGEHGGITRTRDGERHALASGRRMGV